MIQKAENMFKMPFQNTGPSTETMKKMRGSIQQKQSLNNAISRNVDGRKSFSKVSIVQARRQKSKQQTTRESLIQTPTIPSQQHRFRPNNDDLNTSH